MNWLRNIFFRIKFGARSSQWSEVRKTHLKENPVCEVCGTKKKLEVHHLYPFYKFPERELDPRFLIALCRDDHFRYGHCGLSWSHYNENIRDDAIGVSMIINKMKENAKQ